MLRVDLASGVVSRSRMARQTLPPPMAWLADGGTWPDGPFRPDVPDHVVAAGMFVSRVHAARESAGLSINGLAAHAGLDKGTMSKVLAGKHLPDFRTIFLLEQALNTPLWVSGNITR